MENEYALRLKDAVAAERLRDLTDRCAAEREAERARADALLAEKNEAELEYEDQLRQGEQRHQVSPSAKDRTLCSKRTRICSGH